MADSWAGPFRRTGIDARPAIHHYETGFGCEAEPPNIQDLDSYFREHGVDLAVQACQKALAEWGGELSDITHTVAVTCTNQGNPGYDVLVNRELGLDDNAERVLLHGVGCAGGVAIMRVASHIVLSFAARGRPARVLCYACELCTLTVRRELAEAEACTDKARLSIAGAIFSDGAAAFVLCNDAGLLSGRSNNEVMGDARKPLFEVMEWGNATIPDTVQEMSFLTETSGYHAVIGRQAAVPHGVPCIPADFDWALHPGGRVIIAGAQEELGLSDDHLRATKEIYQARGNSSSASVLAVLDLLRRRGRGRDHVAVASFGPGLVCEMVLLRRCRYVDEIARDEGRGAQNLVDV
ncbi:thiolase-like protein [Apiospora hydei]|uniref:Thiolase-like protein n=1 Tax=Apiospora hydei TaxID=1337664 RepID=A0ABR1VKP4_9PEZI